MDDKLIGVIKTEKSEIHIRIARKDGHYYVKIYDSHTMKKLKNPDNAILLLSNNELEIIVCMLIRSRKSKGSLEWDVLISELDNKSLHLRKRRTGRNKFEYDLRKYINTSTLTGWLNTGISFVPEYTSSILNYFNVALSELELLNNGTSNACKKNSSILDNIFSDFEI